MRGKQKQLQKGMVKAQEPAKRGEVLRRRGSGGKEMEVEGTCMGTAEKKKR